MVLRISHFMWFVKLMSSLSIGNAKGVEENKLDAKITNKSHNFRPKNHATIKPSESKLTAVGIRANDEIKIYLNDKKLRCKPLNVDFYPVHQKFEIPVANLRKNPNKKNQLIFIMAGEHPREAITVELALGLIDRLCDDDKYNELLNMFDFRIIVNGNPAGRDKVEHGNYCQRNNSNDIDLNRNWPSFLQSRHEFESRLRSRIGSHALLTGFNGETLEEETKIFKDLLDSHPALVFLSIHSGSIALLHPYARSSKPPENAEELRNVLIKARGNDDSIPVGSLQSVLGYYASGTCLDYAEDEAKVPYPFGMEIYGNVTANTTLNNDDCFSEFNPTTQEEAIQVINRWADIVYNILHTVREKVKVKVNDAPHGSTFIR